MPTPRVSATGLGKLLNSAEQPVYVLDSELTVVFLNQACREWLGEGAEALLGRRCAYHSSPAAGPDALAAGLCPPPAVLSGETSTAPVCVVAEGGRPIERLASFLHNTRERRARCPGHRRRGGTRRSTEWDTSPKRKRGRRNPFPRLRFGLVCARRARRPVQTEAMALHDRIRRFRQEAAVRYRADRLIGEGPAMRLARRQVELAAASRCGVLLVGPPGSGRQHLAAAIHYGASPPSGGAAAAVS